jgi:Ni/Co efflux regulator RcnB
MKKILISTAAAIALAGPMIAGAAYAQSYGQQAQQSQFKDRQDDENARRDEARRNDQRGGRDRRQNWRDDRQEARWDEQQHNGYYDNGHWNYGPPAADRYGRSGFALGYQPWVRGQRLGYYSGRFTTVDYRQHNLRRPSYGYNWVQDERGDFLLVANRSGLIAQVIIAGRDHGDNRQAWRDDRQDARWDNGRHNGYYRNNVWTRGPPPAYRRNVVLGYQPWQRGQRLGYYNGRYAEVDYRQQNLRQPPRGYHWVRDDGGDYLLAAILGGLIAEVIFSNNR